MPKTNKQTNQKNSTKTPGPTFGNSFDIDLQSSRRRGTGTNRRGALGQVRRPPEKRASVRTRGPRRARAGPTNATFTGGEGTGARRRRGAGPGRLGRGQSRRGAGQGTAGRGQSRRGAGPGRRSFRSPSDGVSGLRGLRASPGSGPRERRGGPQRRLLRSGRLRTGRPVELCETSGDSGGQRVGLGRLGLGLGSARARCRLARLLRLPRGSPGRRSPSQLAGPPAWPAPSGVPASVFRSCLSPRSPRPRVPGRPRAALLLCSPRRGSPHPTPCKRSGCATRGLSLWCQLLSGDPFHTETSTRSFSFLA